MASSIMAQKSQRRSDRAERFDNVGVTRLGHFVTVIAKREMGVKCKAKSRDGIRKVLLVFTFLILSRLSALRLTPISLFAITVTISASFFLRQQ